MSSIHRNMRVLASNRMEDMGLDSGHPSRRPIRRLGPAGSLMARPDSGGPRGHQTEWLPPVRKWTSGIFHRCGPGGPAVRGARTGSGARRPRYVRAGRPYGLAHPSAGPDPDQREGAPVEEIRPGDVVWFAPGEKHWYGATATTAISHIAIQEALNGSPVDWMEKVSDEQYASRPQSSGERK